MLNLLTGYEHTFHCHFYAKLSGLTSQVFRIKPPMIITKADADFGYAVIRKSINTFLEKY